MAELELLAEATVGEEEIDHLGHMNVRFYLAKALTGSGILAAELGLSPADCADFDAVFDLRETFTRYYREQLLGAKLAVMGGVLGVTTNGLRFYLEIVNPGRKERAATFVQEMGLRSRETRTVLPLSETIANRALGALVEWPDHGRPRSIDLERVPRISLSEGRDRRLATREERRVGAEECDGAGYFLAPKYQDLAWGGEPAEARSFDRPLHDTEEGRQFGWAAMESRGVLLELPREGAWIQSFGAEFVTGAKTTLRNQWVFDVEREELLCTISIVNLAFDVGTRRAIEIPPAIRARLEAEYPPPSR